MNRQVGIWLDSRAAQLIVLQGEEVTVEEIQSTVEDYHPSGGSTSKTPWGPQDSLDEQKYLQRKKQQLQRYFDSIMQFLRAGDEIYIFGPAEAKVGLKKTMEQDKDFRAQLLAVETADQMTLNQKIAKVKGYFGW